MPLTKLSFQKEPIKAIAFSWKPYSSNLLTKSKVNFTEANSHFLLNLSKNMTGNLCVDSCDNQVRFVSDRILSQGFRLSSNLILPKTDEWIQQTLAEKRR